jgi:signal transduction histidine kinase
MSFLALVAAGARVGGDVADAARRYQWASGALASSATTAAASTQLVGGDEEGAARRAIAQARTAVTALREWGGTGTGAPSHLIGGIEALASAAELAVAGAERGETASIVSALDDRVVPAHAALASDLDAYLDTLGPELAEAGGTARALERLVTALVMVAIPLWAMTTYRRLLRRRVRARLGRLEDGIEAANRLNADKDEFIAAVSHEFRTPLTSIYGFSELLLDDGSMDAQTARDLIGLIHLESSELARLVEDLLTAARLEAGVLSANPNWVDLPAEVAGVAAPWLRTGRKITLDVGDGRIWVDALRLRQVLRNLISNALVHGGPHVGVWARVTDGYLDAAVIDDGPGVPVAITQRPSERFVHAGRRALLGGRLGLGLTIARELVEAMGGTLEYQRHDGITVFALRAPIGAAARGARTPPEAS